MPIRYCDNQSLADGRQISHLAFTVMAISFISATLIEPLWSRECSHILSRANKGNFFSLGLSNDVAAKPCHKSDWWNNAHFCLRNIPFALNESLRVEKKPFHSYYLSQLSSAQLSSTQLSSVQLSSTQLSSCTPHMRICPYDTKPQNWIAELMRDAKECIVSCGLGIATNSQS
jgi:hypothetical protein